MARYYENNIKFMSLYPDKLGDLDRVFRAKFRKGAGFDLPKKTDKAAESMYRMNCGKPIDASSRFCAGCSKRVKG